MSDHEMRRGLKLLLSGGLEQLSDEDLIALALAAGLEFRRRRGGIGLRVGDMVEIMPFEEAQRLDESSDDWSCFGISRDAWEEARERSPHVVSRTRGPGGPVSLRDAGFAWPEYALDLTYPCLSAPTNDEE